MTECMHHRGVERVIVERMMKVKMSLVIKGLVLELTPVQVIQARPTGSRMFMITEKSS